MLLNKDIYREIISKLSDYDVLKTCNSSSYFRNQICDDNFFHKMLKERYPNALKHCDVDDMTYRECYLSIIFIIAEMKQKYNFTYSYGNYRVQYAILKENYDSFEKDLNSLLITSIEKGELPLVTEAINRGANINSKS